MEFKNRNTAFLFLIFIRLLIKCEKLKISHKFDEIESIDLYKLAHSMKNILKLQNLKQKTIENFLKVFREDKYYDEYIEKFSFLRTIII